MRHPNQNNNQIYGLRVSRPDPRVEQTYLVTRGDGQVFTYTRFASVIEEPESFNHRIIRHAVDKRRCNDDEPD